MSAFRSCFNHCFVRSSRASFQIRNQPPDFFCRLPRILSPKFTHRLFPSGIQESHRYLTSIASFFLSSGQTVPVSCDSAVNCSHSYWCQSIDILRTSRFPDPLRIRARCHWVDIKGTSILVAAHGAAAGIPVNATVPMSCCRRPFHAHPRTWISTLVCPSVAVENTLALFRRYRGVASIGPVHTPPSVSMPKDSGVTSSSSTSSLRRPKRPPELQRREQRTRPGNSLNGSFPVMRFTIS